MSIKTDFIWVNGEFVASSEAFIHPFTHSLHYSGAVFEGERSYNGKVFLLEDHTRRLLKSASIMNLTVDYSAEEIMEATYELLKKNSLKDAYIRPLIWRGAESMRIHDDKLTVNLLIAAIFSKNKFVDNLKLNLGDWCKPSIRAIPSQAKSSAHYAMAILSQEKSLKLGYDDTLILDDEGYVAECNVANIFFGQEDKLFTPIADRFLDGLTRQFVIKMARDLGFEVIETRISLKELAKYEYSFITGTSKEIAGIKSIDLKDSIIHFLDSGKKVEFLYRNFVNLINKI